MEDLKYLNWCNYDWFQIRNYKEIDRNLSDIYTDIMKKDPSLLIKQPIDENDNRFMETLFDGEFGDMSLRLLDIRSITNNIIGVDPFNPVVIKFEISPSKTVTYSMHLMKTNVGERFRFIFSPVEEKIKQAVLHKPADENFHMLSLLKMNVLGHKLKHLARDDNTNSEDWINDDYRLPVFDYVSWHQCQRGNIFIRKFTNLCQNLSDYRSFTSCTTSLDEVAMNILNDGVSCVNDMGLVENNVVAVDFDQNAFITAYIENIENQITFRRYEIYSKTKKLVITGIIDLKPYVKVINHEILLPWLDPTSLIKDN